MSSFASKSLKICVRIYFFPSSINSLETGYMFRADSYDQKYVQNSIPFWHCGQSSRESLHIIFIKDSYRNKKVIMKIYEEKLRKREKITENSGKQYREKKKKIKERLNSWQKL